MQVGELHQHDGAVWRYLEASYDRRGQLLERVVYRRDQTKYTLDEYSDGRIASRITFEPDGHTVDYVERFVYHHSGALSQMRWCRTLADDCLPWRVDTVETRTPDGRPLTGVTGTVELEWIYDAAGRLIEKRVGHRGHRQVYEYDERGRLIATDSEAPNDDEGDRREYEYDASGRAVRENWPVWASLHAAVEYSYFAADTLDPGVTITGVEGLVEW